MSDVIYAAITIVFFAAVLAYGRACLALGGDEDPGPIDP